jgi:hypothetical protein
MDMKNLLTAAGLVLACMTAAGVGLNSQDQADNKRYDKGATVTLQGCVTQAAKADTFVLTNVSEWPVSTTDMGKYGKRMYWIEKTDKMKPHVGHTIQVMGTITDVEKSEMEIKPGAHGDGFAVEIEGPGRDVITSGDKAGVKMENRPNKDDIPITLLKLKIDAIKMVSNSCTTAF